MHLVKEKHINLENLREAVASYCIKVQSRGIICYQYCIAEKFGGLHQIVYCIYMYGNLVLNRH